MSKKLLILTGLLSAFALILPPSVLAKGKCNQYRPGPGGIAINRCTVRGV